MPAIKPSVISFILPLLFILFLSPPVWCNDSSTIRDMMGDMDMIVQTECYTNKYLGGIFLDTCYRVLEHTYKCQDALYAFIDAFGNKDPNTVTANDYNGFFNVIPVASNPNSVLFWTGVINIIEKVSQHPGISSSANQPSSLIFNKMRASENITCWCGNKTHRIDYYNPCPPTPTYMFWAKFSALLGRSATGVAFWAAYGNKDGKPYNPNSFFAEFEFPNMVNVTRLVVIDIYNANKEGEQCGQGSLALLQNLAVNKYGNDGYHCYTINGDPMCTDPQQVNDLAEMTYEVIENEWQGKLDTLYLVVISLCVLPYVSHSHRLKPGHWQLLTTCKSNFITTSILFCLTFTYI